MQNDWKLLLPDAEQVQLRGAAAATVTHHASLSSVADLFVSRLIHNCVIRILSLY